MRSHSFPVFVLWLLCCALLAPSRAQVGGVDGSFNPGNIVNGPASGIVRAELLSATQCIIAGEFTSVGGVTRGNIARLNSDGSPDASFASGAGANGPIYAIVAGSGGTFYIAGDFTMYDGVARNRIARITSAGVLDPGFNPGSGCNGPVYALAYLSDSAIYAGGDFTTYNTSTRTRLVMFTSSGTVGAGTFGGGTNAAVRALRYDFVTSYLHVGGEFTTAGGLPRAYYATYSSSGNLSSTTVSFNGPVRTIEFTPQSGSSGKMFVGGDFTTVNAISRGRLAGFTTGSASVSFDPTFNFYLDGPCRRIILPSTARMYVGGDFASVNGQPHTRLAGFSFISFVGSNGSTLQYWDLAPGYGDTGPDDSILALAGTSDGKVVLGGSFVNVAGNLRPALVRLYGDSGSQPPVAPASPAATALSDTQIYVNWNTSLFATAYTLERSSDGVSGWTQIYSGSSTSYIDTTLTASTTAYYRARASNSNGPGGYSSVVSATTAAGPWTGAGSLTTALPAGSVNGSVAAILRQPDGKILIAGSFTNVLGSARKYIARLLPDLSLDSTFDPGVGPNSSISQIRPGPQGTIYIFGSFSTVDGATREDVARLLPNGSLDTSFDTKTTWTFSRGILSQPDGKVILYGSFDTFFGSPAENISRLNVDGSLDPTFQCTLDSDVQNAALQSDGKILIAGFFRTVNGVTHSYFARLQPDGSLDAGFNVPSASSLILSNLYALRDGRTLLTGSFTTVDTFSRKYLARLAVDGTVDATFDPGASVNASTPLVFPQPDGKIVIAGLFSNDGGATCWRLGRLNANGALDATFNSEAGPGQGSITCVLSLPDGSLLVGGSFSTFGASSRSNLVQLKGEPPVSAPTTPVNLAGSALSDYRMALTWADLANEYAWHLERSVSGTNQWQTVADLEWDTTTFTDFGLAAGVTYDYRLSASNGVGSSAFSTTATSRALTAYDQWKLDEGFSLTEPPTADSDGDGIGLLLEYALMLDPHTPDLQGTPTTQMVGGVLALSYLHMRSDVNYFVETSTDLHNWTTTGVNQGNGIFPIAWTTIDGQVQKFLRLQVAVP